MHLRAIRIRGFKSFPEPVEVRLEPGVAVVVGPNGSGKSNVADALLWASWQPEPERAPSGEARRRAVLRVGRPPACPYCQVELVLDNDDETLADLGEVSVMRRVHRGGEGQYLINGTSVRRTDLVELLADVGLGGAAGSVISQGKVEQILASKPEERRALVEEAAGLGKFKRRRHRAELKLARVGQDVARARDIEAEVKKRLRPLAPSGERRAAGGEAGQSPRSRQQSPPSTSPGSTSGSARRRSGARLPITRSGGRSQARGAARRAAPRRGGARRRRRQARGCYGRALPARKARASGSSFGASAAGVAESLRQSQAAPASDGPVGGRAAPPEAAEEAGLAHERLAALERTLPSVRAFRRRRARSPRRATSCSSPSWRSLLETSAPSSRPSRPRRRRGCARRADRAPARRRGPGRRPRKPQRRRRRDRPQFVVVERDELLRQSTLAVTRDGIGYDGDAGAVVPRRGRGSRAPGARGPPPRGRRRGRGARAAGRGRRGRARRGDARRQPLPPAHRRRGAPGTRALGSRIVKRQVGADASRARRRGHHPDGRARRRTASAGRRGGRDSPRGEAGPQPLPALSTSSSPGSRPSGKRLSGDSRLRARSRQRVTTAMRSPRGSSAWDVDARSSGGSIRSPPRSTSARRSRSRN